MYDDSYENLAKFNALYGLKDNAQFKDLFNIFRTMTQQFLLGGANLTMPVNDYIFGYNSTRVQHLYDERAYYDGKEVAIDGFINQISNEASTFRQNEKKGIWTGALDIDNVS